MIVTIHPRVSNRYPTVDTTLPILAESMDVIGWTNTVKIKGSQLLLAGINTIRRVGMPVEPDRYYFMHHQDVKLVRYVTFTPKTADICSERISCDCRMRWYGVDKDGYVLLSPSDVINAGVNAINVRHVFTQDDGYVHCKPSSIRFC